MSENNKKRNPNFSQNEKSLLLHCVYDEKEIIENKKTDGATWKDKENAWLRIEQNFNSQSGTCFRKSESLKRFYSSYKADIRKEAAKEKRSGIQTGGGKPYKSTDPNFELAITIMNPKTVYGLENEFDDDKEVEVEQQESATCQDKSNIDWGSHTPSMLRRPVHPKLKSQAQTCNETIIEDDIDTTLGTEKERTPKIMMSKGFQKQFDNTERPENTPWASRRRPVASTLQSSKISEQYSELSKIKIELAKLQYDTFKEEAIQKKYQSNIEHDLKRKSLELDITIKSEILVKMRKENCTAKDAQNVLKDIQFLFNEIN